MLINAKPGLTFTVFYRDDALNVSVTSGEAGEVPAMIIRDTLNVRIFPDLTFLTAEGLV